MNVSDVADMILIPIVSFHFIIETNQDGAYCVGIIEKVVNMY